MLPCFGDSVAGWSSRMPQSRAHTEIFRDSLAGQCPSREKYLEYFSKFGFLCFLRLRLATCSRVELPIAKNTWINFLKFFVLSALVTGPGDLLATGLNCEKCTFCVSRLVFKLFQFFPRTFYDYSLSSSFHPSPKHTVHSTQTSIVDHLSNLILQEKGMGFYFLTLFYMFISVFLHFVKFC